MDILDVGDGRHSHIAIQVFPRSRIQFIIRKCPTEVARAKVRSKICNAAISHSYLETIGMPNQPVRHKTTITATSNTYTLLVDISFLQQDIHTSHYIERILLAPGSSYR